MLPGEMPMAPSDPQSRDLVRATITHLDSLESLAVDWNPASYRLETENRFAFAAPLGARAAPQYAAGGSTRFSTRLLLDGTGRSGSDPLASARRLSAWAKPDASGLPARLLFAWGKFRFRGSIESLNEEWVLFDREGQPRRGWLDLVLVGATSSAPSHP